LFCEVYEALDPGGCILAESTSTGRLMGSCFFHPRETHFSLGIMNVHPNYFSQGVARKLLDYIIQRAERDRKPVRLVSSAMNLDSFSLYTRAGFVPRCAFQDMVLAVPEDGIAADLPGRERVRDATADEAASMAELEFDVAHIRREKDYRFFIENRQGIWHTSVYENGEGGIDGFLVSISHPGSNMIGPGVARSESQASALLLAELNHRRGQTPVFLLPVECQRLVQNAYAWGAKNCEFHFAQIRGEYHPFRGVVMPTFMPETG
jgi:hypothetical protein